MRPRRHPAGPRRPRAGLEPSESGISLVSSGGALTASIIDGLGAEVVRQTLGEPKPRSQAIAPTGAPAGQDAK
jgi:hypothetical protein